MGKASKRRGALASQNRGQTLRNRGQSGAKKRRQGGKGRPFERGQKDLPGRRYEPGQSGNPGGRPVALKELKDRIQRRGEDLIDHLLSIADGDNKLASGWPVAHPSHRERILAIKELMAYGYGRPVLAVEVSGPGGKPLETRDITEMNSAERARRLTELLVKAGAKVAAAREDEPNGSPGGG